MRADRVVRPLPLAQGGSDGVGLELGVRDLVELLGVGPVGPLDRPVQLGRAGRQDEQPDAARLAGGLELGV